MEGGNRRDMVRYFLVGSQTDPNSDRVSGVRELEKTSKENRCHARVSENSVGGSTKRSRASKTAMWLVLSKLQ